MVFSKLRKNVQIVLMIQSISMLGGASTHLLWTINNGFLSEKYNAPFFSMVFWDTLTFLDPIAAILLIAKPKFGVWLTAIIITIDVFHNTFLFPLFSSRGFYETVSLFMRDWMIISQIAFFLFVLLTFKSNMKEIGLKRRAQDNEMRFKEG